MSIAPLRSLRSFWALGGAPGEFVRRDQRLRESLERMTASSEGARVLADEQPYASLVATLNLSDLFAVETPADRTTIDMASPRQRTAWFDQRPIGDDARRSAHDAVIRDAAARATSHRPGRDDATISRLHGPTTSVAAGARAHEPTIAHVAPELDAQLGTAPSAPHAWRLVARVAREQNPEVTAAVASILASAELDHTPRNAPSSSKSLSVSERRGGPAATTLDQFEKTVHRAERTLAERRRGDSRRRIDEPAHRDSTSRGPMAHDAWIPPEQAYEPAPESKSTSRVGGLRGLAARAGASASRGIRAPLFGIAANPVLDGWPAGELDQITSALDDAARREGVELGELGA